MSATETGAPAVLVLAGLDPSGGAGLWADGEAITAAGGRALLCATAITAQSMARVHSYHPVAAEMIEAQVQALLEDEPAPIRAVKTGMLGSAQAAERIAKLMEHPALKDAAWVVDPVLRSSSGAELVEGGAAAYERILPHAAVVTPNVPEALELGSYLSAGTGAGDPPGAGGGWSPATFPASAATAPADDARHAPRLAPAETAAIGSGDAELLAATESILATGAKAVLLKGGHLEGAPIDRLVSKAGVVHLAGIRRPGTRRGTGCRLASFLAARLAAGAGLPEAAKEAKAYVAAYLDRR